MNEEIELSHVRDSELHENEDKSVIKILISFRSESSLKDAAEFCDLFNKSIQVNINREIIPADEEHLLIINFREPVSELKLRELIKDLLAKANIKNAEITVGGWLTN